MSFAVFVLLIAIVAAVCFYFYRKYFALQFFVKEGIPGPKPHWLIGNLAEFVDESSRHLVLPKWAEQHGKIFGYFEGSRPILVTSDVDLTMEILVKRFQSFSSRKFTPLPRTADFDAMVFDSMLLAHGERWRRLRTIVSPTFSSGKLRALMPLMTKCQDDFMQLVDKKSASGETFDIFNCFKLLTADTISEAAFGIEMNGAKNALKACEERSVNPVSKATDEIFEMMFRIPVIVQLAIVFPEFNKTLLKLDALKAFVQDKFYWQAISLSKLVTEVVEARKANQDEHQQLKRQDLLQMMLDVERNGELSPGVKALSTSELSGQSVVFMVGGYETSSNALAFTCFFLANHQEVQEKLVAEIDRSCVGVPADYDSVLGLPYLDAVICETLRLFPVAPLAINREAVEDTVINGIRIPKTLAITIDIWSVHRDEEQWGPVDPEMFHPERFLDSYPTKQSRHEAAFLPFGAGPRICIGMRFALLEIKLALVNLLRKYRIVKTERTGDTLKFRSAFTITPSDGVHVKLEKRN